MKKSKIVVILVNYNGFDDTKNCLLSIIENESDLPFVVVVDNSSEADLDLLADTYSELKIIRNKSNIGFGSANNVGINWAKKNIEFDYLLLLNNDTLITTNALSNLTLSFNEKSVGIATCKTMFLSNKNIVWYGGGTVNFKKGWPKVIDFKKEASNEGALKSKFVSFASGCVMMFTAESLDSIGPFDERLFMYVEDLELSIRCNKLGYKIWYDSDITIYHKVQGSFSNNENIGLHPRNENIAFQFYHRKKNQWITFRTHLKGFAFFVFACTYWVTFNYALIKLLISSPKRWEVFRSALRVTGELCFKRKQDVKF